MAFKEKLQKYLLKTVEKLENIEYINSKMKNYPLNWTILENIAFGRLLIIKKLSLKVYKDSID